MALRTPPSWLQNGSHPAENDRLTMQSIIASTGIINSSSLAVTQAASPAMSVLVATGWGAIVGDFTPNMGVYQFYNDATTTLSVTSSDPTNPRIDRVVVTVNDAYYSGSVNNVTFSVVAGTPAASPSAPATPTNSLSLATITVGAGVTSILNANITDTRVDVTTNLPVGDITNVTAGTGLTGGGSSGAVTLTNDMATTITASGDIVVGTGSATYDNLPIGTTGQVLTADTTVSPYKVKWATPTTGDIEGVTAGTGLTGGGTSGTVTVSLSTPVAVANGGTGITSFGTGVATFLGTPSSANLAAALTDETGTGAVVFGTSPTITPASGTTTTAASGAGFMGMPQVSATTGADTAAADDAGKHFYSTATRTITIPANSSVAFPVGSVLTFISGVGATTTIAITTDTMYLAGTGTTGSRTLAAHGMATAVKVASTTWYISGNGLT